MVPAGAAVLLVLVLFVFLLLPFLRAESEMPEDTTFELVCKEGESTLLTWPQVQGADAYYVEIVRASNGETVLRGSVDTNGCRLSDLPETALILRVNTLKYYKAFGQTLSREGKKPVEVSFVMGDTTLDGLVSTLDDEKDTVTLRWSGTTGSIVRVYCQRNSETELVREFNGTETVLSFDGTDFPVLGRGESVNVIVEVGRDYPGISIRGQAATMTFTGEDFIGNRAYIRSSEEGSNAYTLSWGETKGDTYLVQQLTEDGLWRTVKAITGSDDLSYETGTLEPYAQYHFRVVSQGGTLAAEGSDPTISEELVISTEASPMYATIWPLKELTVFRQAEEGESVGTVPEAKALCVLGEVDGFFYIRTGDVYGYIDSNYCLINLPDYIGNLCDYDITNSYSAIYKIHEYAIAQVTGTVIKGYEHIYLGGGDYVVPLLYPAAQKLITAALSAKDAGYKLRIYDAYRPREATRDIYDKTGSILDTYVPELPMTGVPVGDLPAGVAIAPAELANQPVDETLPEYLTFRQLMTGGTYSLSSFLARVGSRHNMGVAMDLTLEYRDGGSELKMQTELHDLSQYAVVKENNGNANLLREIMMGAGFGDLSTEWWHFQDDEAYDELDLVYMESGVTPEGWTLDNTGWRYRLSDGTYYEGGRFTVEGREYVFDAKGYTSRDS